MVYTLYFTYLVIGAFLVKLVGGKKAFLFIAYFILLLIIGLRNISVGPDTLSYVEDFRFLTSLSYSRMLVEAFDSSEPLYTIISWLPSLLSNNYTLYLLTWALFPACSLYIVSRDVLYDSKDYLVSIIVFFLLGLFAFYVAGIRQTAALSLVMPAAIRMNRRFSSEFGFGGKLKVIAKYLIIIGIAYLIHNSSLIALLAIPLMFVKVRWWYIAIIIVVQNVSTSLDVGDIAVASELFFNDRFAVYGVRESSLNLSAFIMQLILFLMCFSVKQRLEMQDAKNNFFLMMMLVGLLVQSLAPIVGEMFRISFYFSIFGIVLVPRALKALPKSINIMAYVSFVSASLIYLFFLTKSNLPEYSSVFSLFD